MKTPDDDLLPEELRDLQLGHPRSGLRRDTLGAVRRLLEESPVLEESSATDPLLILDRPTTEGRYRSDSRWQSRWWNSWWPELKLTVATVGACGLLSICLQSSDCRLPATLRPIPPSATVAPLVAELEELEELEEIGPYTTWYRATGAHHDTQRRHDHAVTYRDLDRI